MQGNELLSLHRMKIHSRNLTVLPLTKLRFSSALRFNPEVGTVGVRLFADGSLAVGVTSESISIALVLSCHACY